MVNPLGIRTVSKNVAMNPIAKAIARQKLMKSMVDVKIKLFFTQEGEQIQSVVQEISRLLAITLLACRVDKVTEFVNLMDEALFLLTKVADDEFRWRTDYALIVDDAMDAVLLVTPKISPKAIHLAAKEIESLEK